MLNCDLYLVPLVGYGGFDFLATLSDCRHLTSMELIGMLSTAW